MPAATNYLSDHAALHAFRYILIVSATLSKMFTSTALHWYMQYSASIIH